MPVKPGWEGRYFEDFEVGDIYRCRLGRTVTEADNIWFTLLTNNTNQIHFNNEYGKKTEFGKCLVNSALTLAIVAGMVVADVIKVERRGTGDVIRTWDTAVKGLSSGTAWVIAGKRSLAIDLKQQAGL